MKCSRLLLLTTVLFWLVAGAAAVRVNRLWLSPVTFHWRNLHQPSAIFRWSVPPTNDQKITLTPNTTRSFKVQAPKKFSSGTLSITTVSGSGELIVSINAPIGQTTTTARALSGRTTNLPLRWELIAVQTRTFNVDLMAATQPSTISDIQLQLRP